MSSLACHASFASNVARISEMLTWCDLANLDEKWLTMFAYLERLKIQTDNLSCPTFYVPSTIQTSKKNLTGTPHHTLVSIKEGTGLKASSQEPPFGRSQAAKQVATLGNAEHWRSHRNGSVARIPFFFAFLTQPCPSSHGFIPNDTAALGYRACAAL